MLHQETLHPVEADSVTELCELIVVAHQDGDADLLQRTLGTIGLLVGTITRQQKADTLRAVFREIAQTCSISETKKVLKMSKVGLSDTLSAWLDSQLVGIAQGDTIAE